MRDPVREGIKLYSIGRLRGVWPASELLARVEAIEACRKSIPARRKRLWLCLTGCACAAIIFGALHAWGDGTSLFEISCSIAMFAGIIGVFFFIVMLVPMGMRKYDGDATAVLGPLVRCIGNDLAPGASLKVNASLKPPTCADLRVRTGEKYARPNYPDCVDHFYRRGVLDLECRLRDGTRLAAGIDEQCVETVLHKKNRRGKMKTKWKLRRKICIKVRLLLDGSRCRLTDTLRLPGGTSARVRCHPRGSRIFLTLRKNLAANQRLDAEPLLTMLAGAYGAISMVQHNESIPPGGTK